MKNFTCGTLLLILSIILNPSNPCTAQQADPNNQQLIDQTCKKTPDYNLCMATLVSNPKSTKSDITGLGLIMVDNIKTRATELVQQVNKLLSGSQPADSDTKKALKFCAAAYKAVIVGDVAQATEALNKGAYKFAESGANDAAIEAESCERELAGKVPQLSGMNKGLHDVSVVAAAIVRILLGG